MRRNRKGIPGALKEKFEVSQKVYNRKDYKLMLGYREKASKKNPVILLSTKVVAKSIEKVKVKNNEQVVKKKPEVYLSI